MKFKKIMAALMSAAMLGTMSFMTGCNDQSNSNSSGNNNSTSNAAGGSSSDNSTSEPASDKTFVVGICQLLEHPALDAATKGFRQALTDKLGDKVEFKEQNAQNESANCATIINSFVSSNVDLIMANATPALAAAVSGTGTIPIVGTSITSYEVALDGDSWKGKNITGASDLAPIDQQEDMILEIFPETKKVGILYCSAEPNSKYQSEVMIEELKKDNIEYKEYMVTDSNEIQAQTQAAVGDKCDVIYIPTDNTIANAAESVKNVVLPAKVPVVAAEEGICSGCGTVTLSISYESMGYNAGLMAYEILANGKNAGDLEIGYSDVTKKYNKEICDELGVKIPDGYTAIE